MARKHSLPLDRSLRLHRQKFIDLISEDIEREFMQHFAGYSPEEMESMRNTHDRIVTDNPLGHHHRKGACLDNDAMASGRVKEAATVYAEVKARNATRSGAALPEN